MGLHYCDVCGYCMCGYAEATECWCYECLCEDCVQKVCEETDCEYCHNRGEFRSCDRCDMIEKDDSWHQCLAQDCPVKERLDKNCCKRCWNEFVNDVKGQRGSVKVMGALNGDVIKTAMVNGNDFLREVERLMARHLSLPVASLRFMNKQHVVLSQFDRLQDINGKQPQAASGTYSAAAQRVMVLEWFPQSSGLDTDTGKHECRKLSCGHFTCVLADTKDGCVVCADLREKVAAEQRAKKAAEEAKQRAEKAAQEKQLESNRILADLMELRRIDIKSASLKTYIAELAAKHPQGRSLPQVKKTSLRTFKVTGENKITVFAEPSVDGKKVGTIEPGVCFDVVEEKMSLDGRTYLRLNGDLGWTYTASKKDVKKIVVCEVHQPVVGDRRSLLQPTPARAQPRGDGEPSGKRRKI
eukprot:TRINITY_DN26049_c0_g1_i1.p1 TRINITY_DN26049_c0_g1~~TRINITY_DN26049_c0_g1_i1.p1  ORF type:complete len:412 (+),score=68.25 TRINITY_DN26049_c0_g1_i1:66-1301(+)